MDKRKEMEEKLKEYVPHYWFDKAICIRNNTIETGYGFRWPDTVAEWGTYIWNADIFFGELPFCKTVVLVQLLFGIYYYS